ncbi:MAG: phosphatidate cytidylyltransferase [Chitinophagales bacterium]
MAFNWQTFKTRTLTAIIFAAVMLAGLLINRWTFFILISVIHFGCWWEYLKLVEKIFKTRMDRLIKYLLIFIGYIIFCTLAFTGYSVDPEISIGSFGMSLKWMLYILCLVSIGSFLFQNRKLRSKAKWMSVGGYLYISLSLGLIMNLYGKTVIHFQESFFVIARVYFYPASIIASLWINDTMAYIVGSLVGKTQMSKISPKKTWEGTVGGIIFCVVVIYLLAYYVFHFGIISYGLVILAAIVSITGTFGDLLESKLKRRANVKDSGHIMPGHGGFLDRFDSLLIAIPFVWLYVYFLMR